MTIDEIECLEEGGTEPTIALLRRLDADVRLTAGTTSDRCGWNLTQSEPWRYT
jgi:hypothetical protein